ncbi:MAG TPA: hypothetical protein VE487_08565, partial [Ilumatobacter sp.]|nr:hypothetical protein [Ilumatobacter sp.]
THTAPAAAVHESPQRVAIGNLHAAPQFQLSLALETRGQRSTVARTPIRRWHVLKTPWMG